MTFQLVGSRAGWKAAPLSQARRLTSSSRPLGDARMAFAAKSTLAKTTCPWAFAERSAYNSSEKWCEEMIIRFVR